MLTQADGKEQPSPGTRELFPIEQVSNLYPEQFHTAGLVLLFQL